MVTVVVFRQLSEIAGLQTYIWLKQILKSTQAIFQAKRRFAPIILGLRIRGCTQTHLLLKIKSARGTISTTRLQSFLFIFLHCPEIKPDWLPGVSVQIRSEIQRDRAQTLCYPYWASTLAAGAINTSCWLLFYNFTHLPLLARATRSAPELVSDTPPAVRERMQQEAVLCVLEIDLRLWSVAFLSFDLQMEMANKPCPSEWSAGGFTLERLLLTWDISQKGHISCYKALFVAAFMKVLSSAPCPFRDIYLDIVNCVAHSQLIPKHLTWCMVCSQVCFNCDCVYLDLHQTTTS